MYGRSLNAVPESRAFLPETVETVMVRACREAGLDPSGASLLRLGENMLYQLASEPVVVRIARDLQHWDDAVKEVHVAEWLEMNKVRAAQAYPVQVQQPLKVDRYPVTFWRFIAGRPAETSEAAYLGAVLRDLHQVPRPGTFSLPGLEVFRHVPERLESAPISTSDKEFMRRRVEELTGALHGVDFVLPQCAIHGDAHIKNVMISAGGDPVLIDFEVFAWGQPEWDLAKTATEASMGMYEPAEYEAFVEAYGFDVADWPGFPVLQAVMQLKMVTWLAQNVDHSAAIAGEYQKRILTLRSGELTVPWSGY